MFKLTSETIFDYNNQNFSPRETNTIKKYILGWNYKTFITEVIHTNIPEDLVKTTSSTIGFSNG